MDYLTTTNDGDVLIALYVQPKSSKNSFRGLHGDAMKVAITAPPVDGKANKAVIAFLAKFLGVAKSAVSIQRGLQSRHKQLLVEGVVAQDVHKKIEEALGKD